jgi:hypothetical protein
MELFLRYVKPKPGKVLTIVHNRNQLLLGDSFNVLSLDSNGSDGISIGMLINKVEVFRRRNKPKEPCMTEWKKWDQLALLRYTKYVGCSAPYQKSLENISTCSTKKKMKEWSIFSPLAKNQKDYQPCIGMPRVDFEFSKNLPRHKDIFMLTVGYPQQAKIITQSRAVDVDALIGNIGGYIGLFLGTFYDYNCFPYTIFRLK